jgi:hydroxysqualene synthase
MPSPPAASALSPRQPPASNAAGVGHYENFPVATLLCPARLRPAIAAIYWFARTADDLADEGNWSAEERLADLQAYRADLAAAAQGAAPSARWSGVFTALAQQMHAHALPLGLLEDLLSAFEQDVRYTQGARWYATQAELLDYCRRSANPIGRLLLHLYGVTQNEALEQSDAICTALQLINFWQDLSQDIPRGRYYLPLESLAAHRLDQAAVLSLQDNPLTMKLIAAHADNSLATMLKGLQLPAQVQRALKGFDGWRAALELRCVMYGGLRILEKIAALNHQTLSKRPKLSKWDAVVVLWRALRQSPA